MAFSLALFVTVEDAHAKGKSEGGGGGRSGGGDPIGDVVGGTTKQLDGGGGDLLNNGGARSGGDKKKDGPLSDSPLAADKPKPALADTEPITKKASGDLLDEAGGTTKDPVLSDEPILKMPSSTTDPALAPAATDTKDGLEGITKSLSSEPVPTTNETIQPLVKGIEEAAPATLTTATKPLLDEAEQLTAQPAALVEGAPQLVDAALEEATNSTNVPLVNTVNGLTSPITDQIDEATQQPLSLVDEAVAPIREAIGPVLGDTAKPLIKRAEPLLNPVAGPVLTGVAPTAPLEDNPAALTPTGQIPATELYAPVDSGIPALSPTTGLTPRTVALEPAAASVFEPYIVGEGTSLPSMVGVDAPAMLRPAGFSPTVPYFELGATGSTTLAPLPAPTHAAEATASAFGEIAASTPTTSSMAMDAKEVGTVPVLSLRQRASTLGIAVLGVAQTSWGESFLRDTSSPLSPTTLPIAGSTFGGSAGAGTSSGLGLVGALTLILVLALVDTLLRSAHDRFGADSYLQLAIERPG